MKPPPKTKSAKITEDAHKEAKQQALNTELTTEHFISSSILYVAKLLNTKRLTVKKLLDLNLKS